jgi:DNA-binding NarL/FixJ family response regulator
MNSLRFKSKISAAQTLLGTERERQETEIQKLRAERFEIELVNSTLHLLAQTELLSDLRNDLLHIARKIPATEPAALELRERVKNLPCQSIDWEKFDAQFKAAHPEFAKRLLERFPELTPMETRVCTLLRLNLKSQEIAKMFCLEERSVETHRFNIRRKLKLETKQSLSNFLNAL